MPHKIFITGGSGYVGSTVIQLAIAQGHKVTALSRTTASDEKLAALGAHPIRGSLATFDILTDAAKESAGVIHIADAIGGDYTMTAATRANINDAAAAAIAAGLKGTGKPLVITGGSLWAAADPDGKETDETSPEWAPGHPFAWASKRRDAGMVEAGVRVSYIRLAPWVYGRGGSGVALCMKMWSAAGRGIVVDGGHAKTSAVHVEDGAAAFLLAFDKAGAGEEFNIASETDVELGQIARAICEVAGIECAELAYEEAKDKLGDFLATFLCTSNRASGRKAREVLGWVPKAEKGILEEIRTGSYVEVAKALKGKSASE